MSLDHQTPSSPQPINPEGTPGEPQDSPALSPSHNPIKITITVPDSGGALKTTEIQTARYVLVHEQACEVPGENGQPGIAYRTVGTTNANSRGAMFDLLEKFKTSVYLALFSDV